MKTFREITIDNGATEMHYAANNSAIYELKSARAKDMYTEFVARYDRLPNSRWYNRHFDFKQISK